MLPVTQTFLAHLDSAAAGREIESLLIQHLLEDTERFLHQLRSSGVRVSTVLGIEYSSRDDVVGRLRKEGFNVIVPPLERLEHEAATHINRLLKMCQNDSTSLVIQEVGGYCSDAVGSIRAGDSETAALMGVVEETKNGLWRYQAVSHALSVPVVQIADSRLKKIEAQFVGEAVARALDLRTLQLGETLAGQHVGVMGCGDIGSAVIAALLARRCIVSCFDPDPIRRMEARLAGLNCATRECVLGDANILVGASGHLSVRLEDLQQARDNVLLVSGSSRDVEFPIHEIEAVSIATNQLTAGVTQFTLPGGRCIRVARSGRPINFESGNSLPLPVADLLFAQITVALCNIVSARAASGISGLDDLQQQEIARRWLAQYD